MAIRYRAHKMWQPRDLPLRARSRPPPLLLLIGDGHLSRRHPSTPGYASQWLRSCFWSRSLPGRALRIALRAIPGVKRRKNGRKLVTRAGDTRTRR
jgi:hypothetical protein